MKHAIASPQRRQLMIAGLALAATPTVLFAVSKRADAAAALPPDEPLLVSGRLMTPAGDPLQHATIEFLHAGSERAVTDADGRFMARTVTPRGGRLAYRIAHDGNIAGYGEDALVHAGAVRDEAGLWRASFAATIA